MLAVLTIFHVLICIFLILVVLLQQGKGADLSVFGGGGTQAAFGARGATTILHKLTVGSFVAFIVTTMGIGILKSGGGSSSVLSGLPEAGESSAVEETAAPESEATETDVPLLPGAQDAESGSEAAAPEPGAPATGSGAAVEGGDGAEDSGSEGTSG